MKIKKLVLNKKTIANLSNDELNRIHGGIAETWYLTCPSHPVCYLTEDRTCACTEPCIKTD